MKRIQNGDRLLFDDGKFSAIVINKEQRIIRFEQGGVSKLIDRVGHMPLPPYIRRQDNATDRRTYQTVYAKRAGSVAAPTAGLHFTKPLMTRMKKEGFLFDHVTLHINYGTFAPVECEDVTAHPIHWERYSVRLSTWKRVKAQRKRNRPVIAIGTTSVRVLEHAARSKFLSGQTNLFIYPSFRFRMVDHFVTNFHLPKSTLFMLVCAFGGTELIRRAYREAVREKYRFYSYGDAMLII